MKNERDHDKQDDWTVQETEVNKNKMTKIKENPSTGLYCYRREWLDTARKPNWCYEVVQPVGKDMRYPSASDFGVFAMCISKNDRYLDEKIEWYLNNRFSEDLQETKDQILYDLLKLIAMGVLERKLIRTKDNKSMFLYRLLK